MIDIGALHFLRPAWLWALLAVPVILLLVARHAGRPGDWRRTIDSHLLPHLLDGGHARRGTAAPLLAVSFALAVLALAGPAWRQVEQPMWQSRQPVVVAVDMSSASLATDLAPSRIARLRSRLSLLFARQRGVPMALVAFAGDAFTVAPLTDDLANIALFVDDLQPDVMPVDGQAADLAIAWSRRLLERAGMGGGRIVLITDHADAAAQHAAASAASAGFGVSALGLGTPAGADVRTTGGRLTHVGLDEGSLRALAAAGGGRYARLAMDGSDDAVFDTVAAGTAGKGRSGGRIWQDEGFRLIPFAMLPVLWLLARRAAPALLMMCLMLPFPSRAVDLWRRPDQRAYVEIERGVQAYRRGDFDTAAAHFARADTAQAHYDRGNALAKAGKLPDAVAAYDTALRRQPGMPDAIANRRAVLAAMRKRPPSGGKPPSPGAGAAKPQLQPQPCATGDAACRSDRAATPPPNPKGSTPGAAAKPRPADAAAQARADAAQRERMQRALQSASAGQQRASTSDKRPISAAQRERKLANDAALQRVPDQPGSLLREKFRLEYERRQREGVE